MASLDLETLETMSLMDFFLGYSQDLQKADRLDLLGAGGAPNLFHFIQLYIFQPQPERHDYSFLSGKAGGSITISHFLPLVYPGSKFCQVLHSDCQLMTSC